MGARVIDRTFDRAEVGPWRSIRQVAFASFIGTAVEWYDFFVYGTAAALVFPSLRHHGRHSCRALRGACALLRDLSWVPDGRNARRRAGSDHRHLSYSLVGRCHVVRCHLPRRKLPDHSRGCLRRLKED
jgi:hypothetical protein